MKKTSTVLSLCAMLFALCFTADAQQAGKIFRIGFLDNSTAPSMAVRLEAFRQELSKLGWNERKNITIEYRFAEQKNERLPELAAELVRLKVDLFVVRGTPATLAAKSVTTTIPIVMTNVGDPVGAGLVASLARPGGNVTGFSDLGQELNTKRLEILRDAIPKLARVGLLLTPGGAGIAGDLTMKELRPAAVALKLTPNVRIDVACGKKWKAGREREKGSESTTNGRVSQSGSTKVSESGVAVGGGSGAGVGSIELVSLSMEQALW